jgi:hypothetical protein
VLVPAAEEEVVSVAVPAEKAVVPPEEEQVPLEASEDG